MKLSLFLLLLISISCNTINQQVYENATTQQDCIVNTGYWYKDKCWKNFEDEGIPKDKIDSVVVSQMSLINNSYITIDSVQYPVRMVLPDQDEETSTFIIEYTGSQDAPRSIIIYADSDKVESEKNVDVDFFILSLYILDADDLSDEEVEQNIVGGGKLRLTIGDMDDLDLYFEGEVQYPSGKRKSISFNINEAITGAGTSVLEIVENQAFLSGDLGTITYHQIKTMIAEHPEVKTLVLTNISGSINDIVNMHTGRIVREAGLNTKLLKNSDIASGGVDLFCAGNERIIEKGAKLGIHSWCCIDDIQAIDLPKDHPAHQYQIEYFTMCLGSKLGPDFYFRTLEAAPADDIYWMKDDEIRKWNIATQPMETK